LPTLSFERLKKTFKFRFYKRAQKRKNKQALNFILRKGAGLALNWGLPGKGVMVKYSLVR
jgi:hypothetical protein